MSFSPSIRKAVYDKYGGHCAYCGSVLTLKEMQVDHFIPKKGWNESGSDDIENLMPSCRMCNHYKRAHTLDLFRTYIEEIPRKCSDDYIYKIGVRYGLIEEHRKPIKFYFEEVEVDDGETD